MAENFFPNAEDFDEMGDHLEEIATALGYQVDSSTWSNVQKVVRAGIAPTVFPIGTQLIVYHAQYGDMRYVVVAHDYFKSAKNKNAHTMSIMSVNAFDSVQYDAREAFYYADAELPPGTYYFNITEPYLNWEMGEYEFFLPNGLPAGGQLCIDGSADVPMTDLHVRAYASPTSTVVSESVDITDYGGSSKYLGCLGVELNHAQRVSSGSNNYKESAIRQFLNSSASKGSVWTPQTKYDRPPSWYGTLDGFMSKLDEDFLAVIGEVIVPCGTNDAYESPDSTTVQAEAYTVTDKFYLPSQMEIFGTNSDMVTDNAVLLPYYKNATKSDCIKYNDGVATIWRTRTPYYWNADKTHRVSPDGSRSGGYAKDSYAFSAICTIV